jgi:hypothetical protein
MKDEDWKNFKKSWSENIEIISTYARRRFKERHVVCGRRSGEDSGRTLVKYEMKLLHQYAVGFPVINCKESVSKVIKHKCVLIALHSTPASFDTTSAYSNVS